MVEEFVVVDGLDMNARAIFVSTVTEAINAAAGSSDEAIVLDCSKVTSLDEGTLGMLALVARSSQRRGTRLMLHRASRRIRAELEEAGIGHFFD